MNLLDVALREIEPVRSPKISLKLKDFPPKKKKIWKTNRKKKKSKLELRKRTWWPKISLELKDFPPNKKRFKILPQIYLLLLLFVVKSEAKRWVEGVWKYKIERIGELKKKQFEFENQCECTKSVVLFCR